MVLHVPVNCVDLKIYIINHDENGSSVIKTHLYDHLSVSPAMAVGVGCAVERQSPRFNLSI
jgi:hypothetical protein